MYVLEQGYFKILEEISAVLSDSHVLSCLYLLFYIYCDHSAFFDGYGVWKRLKRK